MLALKSPEIEVIGITIVWKFTGGDGIWKCKENPEADESVWTFLCTLGKALSLRRDYVNALDTRGEDGLGESFLPEVTGYHQQISAVDFLADVLKKRKYP